MTRSCSWSPPIRLPQPQRDLCRLHRHLHHRYELVLQLPQINLVAQPRGLLGSVLSAYLTLPPNLASHEEPFHERRGRASARPECYADQWLVQFRQEFEHADC
jgi:hypothetical protein